MWYFTWILGLGLALAFGISYNRFVNQRQLIANSWSNVGTELQRRFAQQRVGIGLRRGQRAGVRFLALEPGACQATFGTRKQQRAERGGYGRLRGAGGGE